jgi:RNA polymerase sigma factor (sigma-70 family)
MATTSLAYDLGSLFQGGSATGLSDRQLIERFATRRDEAGDAAFAALVARHGPMVLGVCRQIVGDQHQAEDAFQAVFLVLADKARSLREPDLLGHWLYGVAVRTARCARLRLSRRRRAEETGSAKQAATAPAAATADQILLDGERAEALHGEIDRLPGAFRLPVVLCYFEGLTLDEAAHRLRWPVGTTRSRLARAREKLRRGLTRRGFALPGTVLAAMVAPRSASASVLPIPCESITRAAIAFAARHAAAGGALSAPVAALSAPVAALSAPVAALAQEVLNTMLIHKLRLAAMTALALAALATGAGYLAVALAGVREGEPRGEPSAQTARTEPRSPDSPRPPDPPRPAEGRMTVTGRVFGPDGKPVTGADVDLVAWRRTPRVGTSDEGDDHALLAQGRTDTDGRYRLDAPRTASTRVFQVYALAAAPGYGLGWADLNPDADQPDAEIKLQPEQVARARLVEVSGAPARGVEVRVSGVRRPNVRNEGRADGVSVGVNPPEGLRTWPKAVTTDNQGRIAVTGVGRGVNVGLAVRDLRYARQGPSIDAAGAAADKEFTVVLKPAQLIEGRVLADDTGQPIPNAIVSARHLVRTERALGMSTSRFRADAQGHFVMNLPASENYTLEAFPTGGEPYLPRPIEVQWTKGAVKASHDVKVRRGVAIRGKVTEQGTGRPLPGSSVQYVPLRGGDVITWDSGSIKASRDDGSFAIAVPPDKGHLIVFGPTPDYILGEIGSDALYGDRSVRSTRGSGGIRARAHAIIAYDVKAGDPPLEVNATLRLGATIKGRALGPDGQTVADASIITTLDTTASNPTWPGFHQLKVRDGRFELRGLDPATVTRIWLFDPEHEWGATIDLSGKQADDVTIRLQPCGRAEARFVGPDGKPIAGHQPMLEFVASPGPSQYDRMKPAEARLMAESDLLANIDRKHYGNGPRTHADGRLTMVSLIPGALYRITDFSTANDEKGVQIRKDFTVKPGETVDLGDIVIAKAESQ